MSFNFDENALRRQIENSPGFKKIQADANELLRATLREVRDEMAGQPADEVYPVLVARVTAAIPGSNLNEVELRKIADEIEATSPEA